MHRFPRYCVLATAALAMTLLAVSLGQRIGNRKAAPRSLDYWDIPELADDLNRAGLDVRLCSVRKDGVIGQAAFLTTSDKDWDDLNRLVIGPGAKRIQLWRGTVRCERVGEQEPPSLIRGVGDHYLVAGPFFLYGDAELLERIRVILGPSPSRRFR